MLRWPAKLFWVRVALWAVLLVISGGLYISYRWSLRPPPDYASLAGQGGAIVEAVYRYRNDRGLWPEYLDQLGPAYFPHPPKGWDEGWDYVPGQRLARTVAPGESVEYRFVAGQEGWRRIDTGGRAHRLAVAQTRPAATLTPEQLAERRVAELTRRIRSEPTQVVHYRRQATTLLALGRTQDALAVCQTAVEQVPDHWWPRLAVATLTAPVTIPATSATAPTTNATAAESLAQWVAANPSFTRCVALAVFAHQQQQAAPVLPALRQALTLPLELERNDFYNIFVYLFDATRLAYEAGDPELALQFATLWENRARYDDRADRSYLAFRAAAELAQKHTAAAAEAAQEAIDTHANRPLWAGHLPELQRAATRPDPAFRYDPGPLRMEVFGQTEGD